MNLLGVYQIHTEYNILEVYPDGFLFCVGYGVPCHNEADCNNCKVHMEYMVSYLTGEIFEQIWSANIDEERW